jgi:hypothetical protein
MDDHADDQLTPLDAARDAARPVHDLAAAFMLDGATYVTAAAEGYEGIAFYYAGRGGVLGDVDADEVTEAFVFFPPASVRAAWEGSAAVEDRTASALRFAACGAEWARAHLPVDAVDYARLAELAGRVEAAADASGAPVFAGWRDLPEPTGDRELALHRMNALRELRAARHGAAVLEAGIAPVEALMVRTPYMADIFGWPEPRPEPDEALRARWAAAEDATNERFARDLAVLDADELAEFCALANAALAAVT